MTTTYAPAPTRQTRAASPPRRARRPGLPPQDPDLDRRTRHRRRPGLRLHRPDRVHLPDLADDRRPVLTTSLWPHHWQWSNYRTVFSTAPIGTWLANTVLYAVAATAATLLSSVPIAYALARLRFKGRNVAFLCVITMMMLPPQVLVIPMYLMWARLHLTGTIWPLVLLSLFGDAFSVFLLRQFLLTVPEDYLNAARIDGCGELRVLTRVVLPMMRPALVAVGLFSFFNAWNDYYGPLIYTGETPAHWTLALGLATFKTSHAVQWNLTMAATLIAMAPVIIVFFFAQKAFIEGVTLTGVKG